MWLANQAGLKTSFKATPTETKLSQLSRDIRHQGLRWQREPHWLQLQHDLALVDFRLAIEQSVKELPNLEIEQWLAESEFLLHTDTVEFTLEVRGQKPRTIKRGVRPDGYFVLLDKQRKAKGLPYRARFLVEMDIATHDLNSFVTEKAMAGYQYIQSAVYESRFGDNNGCWLVITTTEVRRQHLECTIINTLGEEVVAFLFATTINLYNANLLRDPIWWPAGKSGPISLGSPPS